MEDWVREWVQARRGDGEQGIEIKHLGNSYYVYRSTTVWDKEAKKRRKRSVYLGKLDEERGFIRRDREIPRVKPKSVRQYGNAMLLHRAMTDILPLLRESFAKHWQEIYALAITRILGAVPLKRVGSVWERLYDPNKLTPKLSPKQLAAILRDVGGDWSGQDLIFRELARNGRQFVYDLSVVFTSSEDVTFAEAGYNKDHVFLPQIQLALLYTVDNGLPTMIRALPGSIKGKILILDRGFYSEDVVAYLLQREISFLLPTRRNSTLYDVRIHLTRHFFYRERLIRYGKRRIEGYFLYLFEDAQLGVEEEKTLYKRLDEGKLPEKSSKRDSNEPGGSSFSRI